jgi:F0F1-type ATP synthase membrane subunit b/b'
MLAFIINFLIVFAEGAAAASDGGWLDWWNRNVDPYMNYPGFEAWRFLNLIIFFSILAYILKRPLSAAFKAKREAIRADLIRAEEERKAAVAKLAESEARLAGLEAEKARVVEHAKFEAEAEKERIEDEIRNEKRRLREQAENEIERKSQQVRVRLRKYSAEESIRLAEEKIRSAMNSDVDSRLVKANIRSIGGME